MAIDGNNLKPEMKNSDCRSEILPKEKAMGFYSTKPNCHSSPSLWLGPPAIGWGILAFSRKRHRMMAVGNDVKHASEYEKAGLISLRDCSDPLLCNLVHSIPDVREDIVNRIRSQLDRGNYRVKAERIAEKILEHNLLDGLL